MIRVVLVDDHAVVRTGFRLLLQSHAEVNVVGTPDRLVASAALKKSQNAFDVTPSFVSSSAAPARRWLFSTDMPNE